MSYFKRTRRQGGLLIIEENHSVPTDWFDETPFFIRPTALHTFLALPSEGSRFAFLRVLPCNIVAKTAQINCFHALDSATIEKNIYERMPCMYLIL
jgi:hypothetical protein